jgi:hypothetical protein
MRLEGAFGPNTFDETIVGTAIIPAPANVTFFKNSRLEFIVIFFNC